MNTIETRRQLAAVLGMLGSDAVGERAAAGVQAERLRRLLNITWNELLTLPTKPITWPQREPEQPASTPPPTERSPAEAWEERVRKFHADGNAAYANWRHLCETIINLGADAQFSELLIARPDAVQLVKALVRQHWNVRRIARLRSADKRERALAAFADKMHAKQTRRPAHWFWEYAGYVAIALIPLFIAILCR